jgi:hypothetical protein
MVRINYGKDGTPHVVKHVFCTERHKQFFINSVKSYGNLPPGFKRSFILQLDYPPMGQPRGLGRGLARFTGFGGPAL